MEEMPPVTLIVTAYNEEKILEQKLRNTLAIDYPKDKLKILFVTDGSDDASVDLIKRHPSVHLLHQTRRQGKYAAIKRAMRQVTTPFVVFSDANTMLNAECLRKIIIHYQNKKTGGVAGEKKILRNNYESVVGEAEGMYWQYESFMKKMDAEFYTVVGAAGELFSIRTELFRQMNDDIILDDFIISMQVCLQGFKMKYEPDAFATESPSVSLFEEEKRKTRISAGAYQSIVYLKECLNFFRYPRLSFQFISRRLLRWVFCPLALISLLTTNIILLTKHDSSFFSSLLLAQTLFYVFAFFGLLFVRSGKRAGLFTIPFYFVFMNYCLVKGFIRFAKGKQTVLWEKSLRQAVE
jgi:cellulose synthase/poly-beta-1,6-N-acetylglucosamine synthase-like glycosyltransferase